MSVEEQLQREAGGRRVAAGAAIGAVLLTLVAQLLVAQLSAGAPVSSPGAILDVPGFYRDNAVLLIVSAGLLGLASALTAIALDRLYQATAFRRPQTPRAARALAYAGGIGLAVGAVISQVALTIGASRYLAERSGDYFAARELLSSDAVIAAGALGEAGRLALAFAFVLISLNAMRAGLLTRFMGILGVIAGVLLVVRLDMLFGIRADPIVHLFWLAGLAYLFLGRWPGGLPPAWRTGRAEPWPTTQEIRERRDATRAQSDAPAEEAEVTPSQAPVRPHPGSRKRRGRKRR